MSWVNRHCHSRKTFKCAPIFLKNFPWNQRWGKQKKLFSPRFFPIFIYFSSSLMRCMHDYRLSSRWEKIVANPICMSSHSFLSAYLLLDEIRKCTFHISYRLNIIMHLWSRLEFIFGEVRQSSYMLLCSSYTLEEFLLRVQWNNSIWWHNFQSHPFMCASLLAGTWEREKLFAPIEAKLELDFLLMLSDPFHLNTFVWQTNWK